jgi:nitrogen-specific signal transduction histidine kinase
MIHTKFSISFLADLEGIVFELLSNEVRHGVFNKETINTMLRTRLNRSRTQAFLKQLNVNQFRIIRLYFSYEGVDISAFLCGIKIEDHLFFTFTFNNKIVIPAFYQEFENYKRKKLYEFRENVIHDDKKYSDILENDLKVYEELKATIADLSSAQYRIVQKNSELQELLEEYEKTILMLEKSEEKQRRLLDNLDEGIVIADENGDLVQFNEEYLRIFELDPEMIKSKKIWEIKFCFTGSSRMDLNKLENMKKSFLCYFHSPVDILKNHDQEVMLVMKNGKTKNIEEHLFKFTVKTETFVGCRFRDVTEKKRFINEYQLIHQNEATKFMLRGLSNNFNTRFQSVIGNISMAMNYINEDNKSYLLLKNAIESFPKINEFSKQIAMLIEEGEYPLTKQKIDLVFSEITSKINDKRFEIIIEEFDLPPIYCNLYQLKTAVLSILENSKDSMPNGGVIRISFEKIRYNYQEKTYEEGKPNYICFNIHDEGIGIPSENLNRIFDPFFTTYISHKKGLGLTITYSIIKKHKGFIEVTSEVGVGTTVRIYLPINDF